MGHSTKFLTFLAIFVSSTTFANVCESPVSIISDFDDTIKAYNEGSEKGDKLLSRLFSKKTYPASAAFLRASKAQCSGNRLTILTASPPFLKTNAKKTLKQEGGIPYDELIMRDSLKEEVAEYKFRTLDNLFQKLPHQSHILIGDNTRADPATYRAIQERYPNKVSAVYIHKRESNKVAVTGTIEFHLFLEVAIAEFKKGRLGQSSLEEVLRETLKSKLDEAFPLNHHCPESLKLERLGLEDLDEKLASVENKVRRYCKLRNSNMLLEEDEIKNKNHNL